MIVDKNPPDSGYLNGNEAQDYVWLLSWCQMCVLTKWNLRKWFARRRKTMRVFNERLFDLGIGNWNVLSRRRLALFSRGGNTVCSPFFFLRPSSRPLPRFVSFILLPTAVDAGKGIKNEILTILERVNEGEMTSIFSPPSPLWVDEQESSEQT